MCRSEPKMDYQLSRFIALTIRMIRREVPECDCIIAFADPEHGHEGTVYKASGFQHDGMTNGEWHTVGPDGIVRHRRFAFRHARRNGISIGESRNRLGLTRVRQVPKHRWIRRFK